MAITKVWVTEECTACALCSDTAPDVFVLEEGDEIAKVVEGADFNSNEELIKQAAEECPVEAIKFEEG